MDHDDFATEPVKGLPEALPKGEHIIWQGKPSTWRLAVEALWFRPVAGYFLLLIFWRFGASLHQVSVGEAIIHTVPFLVAGLICCGILYGLAMMLASTTIYTLTNRRVALRIGLLVTLNLNLPHSQIANAMLATTSSGHGNLAFEIKPGTSVSYLMIWPHVRPWHLKRAQPALRCIQDAGHVAQLFAEAAESRISEPVLERTNMQLAHEAAE